VGQWHYKREFALNADRRSRTLMERARENPGEVLEAINTLSWARDELLLLDAKATGGRQRVVDESGRPYASQPLSDGRLAVWVNAVPALAARRLLVVAGRPAGPPRPATVQGTTLDNGRLRVVVDPATGAIRSARAAATGDVELVSTLGMNGYLYVPGLDPAAAVGPGPSRVTIQERGPLVATLRIESDAPGARRLVRRVTLVAGDDRLWLETVLDKTPVRDKESVHLAFGVDISSPVVRVDQGEALVTIGGDQLPGSCMDFAGAHSAVDVSSDAWGVSIATLDAPLLELGAITDERRVEGAPRAWRTKAAPGGAVFAYLLNNYWHTNYKAYQEGELRFRFAVQPHAAFDPAALRRFSAAVDAPLLVMRVSAATPPVPPPFRLEAAAAIVSALRPLEDGAGLRVRLYNPSASPVSGRLTHLWRGRVVNLVGPGESRGLTDPAFKLAPFGSLELEVRRQTTDIRSQDSEDRRTRSELTQGSVRK
jgi:hypothetical protein